MTDQTRERILNGTLVATSGITTLGLAAFGVYVIVSGDSYDIFVGIIMLLLAMVTASVTITRPWDL